MKLGVGVLHQPEADLVGDWLGQPNAEPEAAAQHHSPLRVAADMGQASAERAALLVAGRIFAKADVGAHQRRDVAACGAPAERRHDQVGDADPDQRRQDIAKWVTPLLPLRDAAIIVLRLARESGQASKVMAMQGSYQQMLSGRSYQLMQVRVSPELRVIPEASANKYMLWVRFTVQDGDLRPRAVDVDVPFQLTLCSL